MIPNISVAIVGAPKSGKTHLALTLTPPIVVYSFDVRGADLLLPKFKGKQIVVKPFIPPISDTLEPDEGAPKFWQAIKADYQKTVDSGEFKTVVLDPATMLWEIIRDAWQVAKHKQHLMSRDYGDANRSMAWVLTYPLLKGMNVVSINYLRDKYVDDQATGEKEIDGFKRTEGLVDVILQTVMKEKPTSAEERKATKRETKSVVVTRVEKCRFDRDLNGMELTDATFEDVATLLGA